MTRVSDSAISRAAKPEWRRTAWNGLGFDVPVDWRLTGVGLDYLKFEDETGPTLELKWARAKGFSPKARMRRLASFQQKSLRKSLKEWEVPGEWRLAAGGRQLQGFSWNGEIMNGRGGIIHCPESGLTALFQFFPTESQKIDLPGARWLASLRYHAGEAVIPYSLFDFKVEIPQGFRLTSHLFQPGYFALSFRQGSRKIDIQRFGPASILLKGQDIEKLAATLFKKAEKGLAISSRTDLAVEWDKSASGFWAGVIGKWGGFSRYKRRRLWLAPDANRLLAVTRQGPSPLSLEEFDLICSSYEVI